MAKTTTRLAKKGSRIPGETWVLHFQTRRKSDDVLLMKFDLDGCSDSRRKGEYQRNGFKTGYQVEGSLFWNGFETFRSISVDGEDSFWLCDVDGAGTGLSDGFGRSRYDWQDELKRR